ncbi:hypothetical protein [Arvimicrobium flavum]|uniref:hypothetical protein n=1 Tax=Arvimicrobium flavum TaxID=3393320 RepID=UPI00237A6476|nr:hypothetical protein [Mesorhizobium shangrilense]
MTAAARKMSDASDKSQPNRPISSDSSIFAAALWLATGSADRTRAITPQLQRKFSLTVSDAVQAIREANLIRARAM